MVARLERAPTYLRRLIKSACVWSIETTPDGLTVAMNGGENLFTNRFITGSALTKARAISSPVALADVSVKHAVPEAIISTTSI